MDKSTIFFSHSSKDKDLILPIKNKIEDITAGVLEIFMSSDGQSIPFGHNWVHRIESGLSSAQIMFVFVTSNSINSAWIYFEAGYAYSKEIEVIPVGIGVDIGNLKAPLNLLQGFNVMSGDSLNNFISVINNKFNTHFKEQFLDLDYELLNKSLNKEPEFYDFNDVFSFARFSVYSQYSDSSQENNILRYDIDKWFQHCKEYLNENSIPYSSNSKAILTLGLKIQIEGVEKEPNNYNGTLHPNQNHKLTITISMMHFKKSFELLRKLSHIKPDINMSYLHFHYTSKYTCLTTDEVISSVVSDHKDVFSYEEDRVGSYLYKEKVKFSIFDLNKFQRSTSAMYVLALGVDFSKISIDDIVGLIYELINDNIIFIR